MNEYSIHEAIARNATIQYDEPADDGSNVVVNATCLEVITQGIAHDQSRRKLNPKFNKPIPSANDMILDYLATHWATILPK